MSGMIGFDSSFVCAQSKGNIEKSMHEILDEYDQLQSSYRDLEKENHELRVALINSEEDVAEWKRSYESMQEEGNQLFQAYDRKCNSLKQLGVQLAECKSALEENKNYAAQVESELQSARELHDELKSKCRSQSELNSKQESRYFALKEEYNDTLSRLEFLERQRCSAADAIPAPTDCEPLPIAALITDIARLAATIDQCHAAARSIPPRPLPARADETGAFADADGGWRDAAELPAGLDSPTAGQRGPGEAHLFSLHDAVGGGGGWGHSTPRRGSGRGAAAAAAPKTPGQAFLQMEALSPLSLREHAESLAISNDLLRQVREQRGDGEWDARGPAGPSSPPPRPSMPCPSFLRPALLLSSSLARDRPAPLLPSCIPFRSPS
jgi:hypothetical protein